MTTAEILLAAADEIERSGLHKGWFWRWGIHTGPCCAVGAIRRVTDDDEDRTGPAFEALTYYLRNAGLIPSGKAIPFFNDDPSRTAADVIAALRAAAEETK